MKREKNERTLYIGLDESNHGKFPETLVGTSSVIKTDAIMRIIHGKDRITSWELIRYFVNRNRDFVSTKIKREQFAKHENSLIECIPNLTYSLFTRLMAKNKMIDSIELMIDGEKTKKIERLEEKIKLIKDFTKINDVNYNFFPKSDICSYKYSPILRVADSLANYLFRGDQSIKKIATLDRIVKLNT